MSDSSCTASRGKRRVSRRHSLLVPSTGKHTCTGQVPLHEWNVCVTCVGCHERSELIDWDRARGLPTGAPCSCWFDRNSDTRQAPDRLHSALLLRAPQTPMAYVTCAGTHATYRCHTLETFTNKRRHLKVGCVCWRLALLAGSFALCCKLLLRSTLGLIRHSLLGL